MKYFTSSKFRKTFTTEYPGIDKHPDLMRLVDYILFGHNYSDTSTPDRRVVILDRLHCAIAEGKQTALKADKYASAPLLKRLEAFLGDGMKIDYDDYNSGGRAREAVIRFTPVIEEMIAEGQYLCCLVPGGDNSVEFVSGKKRTKNTKKEVLKLQRIELKERIEATPECSKAIVEYLNELTPNGFKQVVDNMPIAQAMVKEKYKNDKETLYNQLMLLQQIEVQPKPLYGPSKDGNTNRVFGINQCLLQLWRPVREVLMEGWVSVDIRSAQLAIIGKIWIVPEVTEFLQTGKSIWQELADYMGYLLDDEFQSHIKTFLYSLIFGAGKVKLMETVSGLLDDEEFNKLCHQPIIKALFHARKKVMNQIIADGGAQVLESGWISYKAETVERKASTGGSYKAQEGNERSIMAQQAQAIEKRLIESIYELSDEMLVTDRGNQIRRFTVMAHLHDGVYIKLWRKNRGKVIFDKIRQAFDKRCKELGIEGTGLDIKELKLTAEQKNKIRIAQGEEGTQRGDQQEGREGTEGHQEERGTQGPRIEEEIHLVLRTPLEREQKSTSKPDISVDTAILVPEEKTDTFDKKCINLNISGNTKTTPKSSDITPQKEQNKEQNKDVKDAMQEFWNQIKNLSQEQLTEVQSQLFKMDLVTSPSIVPMTG